MTVQTASSELERMSGARRWILGLALVAVIFISVIVGLLVTRPERYEVIQNFAAIGRGAKAPMGLTVDKAGYVYGSTATGGPGSWGTIFELISPRCSDRVGRCAYCRMLMAGRLGLDRSGA